MYEFVIPKEKYESCNQYCPTENWNLWLFKKSVEKWFIVVHVRFQLSTSPKLHGPEVTYGLRQFVNQFILKPQKRRAIIFIDFERPLFSKGSHFPLKGSHKWMAPLSVSGSIPPHSLIRLHCLQSVRWQALVCASYLPKEAANDPRH